METKLGQFRKQYPQYDNRSDDDLLKALHAKHYADRDYDDFVQRMTAPLPGMDEAINPETGQPWTPAEIEGTKISPAPGYETDMNPERSYSDFEEPEGRVTAGEYGTTMQAGAARIAANRLNEMEAERRKRYEEIVAFRVKQEGEENRAKIEGETQARMKKYGTGTFYDAFIRPNFSKDGKTPGERISDWADAKLRTRSEVAQRKGEKAYVARDAKWYSPSTWFDETTVFADPEAFFLKVAENAPQIGVSYGSALVGGKAGAVRALRNLGDKAKTNPALVREVVDRSAKRTAQVAGGATEYVLIRDAVANETRERILDLPDEKFFEYPGFDDMQNEVGFARAKQMVADEKARHAGMVAAPLSAVLGAPASGLMGRIGAGTGATGGNLLSRVVKGGVKGGLAEMPTEGLQEVIENIAGNIGVSMVDPEQAWTEGSLNAFFGGVAIGGTFGAGAGALGGIAPETGQTKDTRSLLADEKTRNYLEAARDREKVQARMSDMDQVAKMSTRERLEGWEELERLEEKEAQLMLKAEPGLRRNILERSLDPEAQKRAFHLLDTLTAKSRTTLKQIEMMRRERKSEDQITQQAERQEQARQEIQRRVERDMTSLQEYEAMAQAIEEVQQGGVIDEAMYEQLADRGYGRWTDKQKSEFVITKKGQTAVAEMRRQIDQLSSNLETGYVGPERRRDLGRRERVAQMTPEQMEQELYRESNTKLKNRRAYQDDERVEPSEAVAVVDADSLKWVNDNMGHTKGDYLLRKIARALRSQAGDRAYHISGDEFVVTADSQEELEQIMTAAEEKLASLRPISEGGKEVAPGISWGIGTTLEEADKAMSAAKTRRTAEGRRAQRGEAPPSLREVSRETTEEAEPEEERGPTDTEKFVGDLRLSLRTAAGVKRFRRATKNEMRRARRTAYSMTQAFRNLPKGFITLVNTVEDLPAHMQQQLYAMGASMTSVKGMFDEQNPRNGIFIVVGNIKPPKGTSGWVFERDVAEVVMHETIGHYGLRGLLGSQSKLNETMDAIAAAFPDLVNRKALQYTGKPYKSLPDAEKRIMSEEMVADIAGKILAERITLDKQQKSAWRRLMESIRNWLIDHGLGRFARGPLAFKDADLLEMIQRSQDFVRHQNNWSFTKDTGESISPYRFMRDSEIYLSRLATVFSERVPASKRVAKELNVPKGTMVSVLPETATRAQWINKMKELVSQGRISQFELDWSALELWLEPNDGGFTWKHLMQSDAMPFDDVYRLMKEVALRDPAVAKSVKAMEPAMAMLQEPLPRNQEHQWFAANHTINYELNTLVPAKTKIPKEVLARIAAANNIEVRVRPPNGYRFNSQLIYNYVKSRNPDKDEVWLRKEADNVQQDWQKNGPPFGDPAFQQFGGFAMQQGSYEIPFSRYDRQTIEPVTGVTFDDENKTFTMTFDRTQLPGAKWPQGSPLVTFSGYFEYFDPTIQASISRNLPTAAWITEVTDNTITFSPEAADSYWNHIDAQQMNEIGKVRVRGGEITVPTMAWTSTEYDGNSSKGLVPETYREWLLRIEGRERQWYAGGHWRSNTFGSNSTMHLRTALVYDGDPDAPYLQPSAKGLAYFLNEIQSDWLQAYAKHIDNSDMEAARREMNKMRVAALKIAKQMHEATTDAFEMAFNQLKFDQLAEGDREALLNMEREAGPEAAWDQAKLVMARAIDEMQKQAMRKMNAIADQIDKVGQIRAGQSLVDYVRENLPVSDVRMMDFLHIEAFRYYLENDIKSALDTATNAIQTIYESDIRDFTKRLDFSEKFEAAGRKSVGLVSDWMVSRAWDAFKGTREVMYAQGNDRGARLPYLRKMWEETVEAAVTMGGQRDAKPIMDKLRRDFDKIDGATETKVRIVPTDDFQAMFGPEVARRLLDFYEPQMSHDYPGQFKAEEADPVTGEKHLTIISEQSEVPEIEARMRQISPFVADEIRKAVVAEFEKQTQSTESAQEQNALATSQGGLFDQASAPVPPTRTERRWQPTEDNVLGDLARYDTADDGEHNDYGVDDFQDFENGIDFGDEVNEYWDNFDWDDAQLNGEDLDESHSAYTAIEEVQGYTAAEEWLRQARENYQNENEQQAYDYVRDDINYRYHDSGEGPFAHYFNFSATDEDGDPVPVRVVLRRRSVGSDIELVVELNEDGTFEELASGWSEDIVQGAPQLVLDYLLENDLTPATMMYAQTGEEVTVPNTAKPDAGEKVPVPQVTVKNPNEVDWKLVAEELEKNLVFQTGEPLGMAQVVERHTKAWNTQHRKEVSTLNKPPITEKKNYEAAIQFLISDAVRNGTRKIMWHQGESTTARGGASLRASKFKQITYSPMTYIDVTGRRNKVYRIAGQDTDYGTEYVYYFREQELVQTVGHDVARYIKDQMAGKKPTGLVDKNGKLVQYFTPDRKEPSLDDIIVRQTRGGEFVAYHQNFPRTVMARKPTRQELRAALEEQLEEAKRIGRWPFADDMNSESGSDIDDQGRALVPDTYVVKMDDIGGYIGIMTGGSISPSMDYRPTHTMRHTVFGSRYAYGPKLESAWNKFLKKYGVQIEDMTRMAPGRVAKTGTDELLRVVGDPSAEQIMQDYGRIGVVDLGNGGPYIVESEKKGMISDTLFKEAVEAEQEMRLLKEQLSTIYGMRDPKLLATRGFIITDEMIEDAQKGWPLLSYSPYDDPIIQEAAKRIGARKKPLRERYNDMVYRWADKFNQGMFDRFHGIKAAMRRTGLGNPSAEDNPYIQARLTTSLDSVMKAVMEYGHPVWREGIVQTEGRGLLEILQPVAKQLDLWGMYMAGVRAKRLLMDGLKRMPQDQRAILEKAAINQPGNTPEEKVWSMVSSVISREKTGLSRRAFLKGLGGAAATKILPDLPKLLGNESWLEKKAHEIFTATVEELRGSALASILPKDYVGKEEVFEVAKAAKQRVKEMQEEKERLQKIAPVDMTSAEEELINAHYRAYELFEEWQEKIAPKTQIGDRTYELGDLEKALKAEAKVKLDMGAQAAQRLEVKNAIDSLVKHGREKNFTPEMIEKMVNLGEQFPVFKDVARDYAAFNKQVLDFAEEAGIINPETRPMWENADYVPFYRVQDERLVGPLGKGKGIADVSSPVKRLKGGEDPIGDITHNIMMNLTQLVDSAMKNHAAKMAVDALDGTGLVQKMPWAFSAQLIPMKQVEKLLVQHGMDPATIPDEAKTGFQQLFAMQPPKGEGVISIMRDGKKEFYYTDDVLLYESMTAINQKQWGLWMRLLRKPKRLLTTAITLDPGFMIRNYIRDLLSAFVVGRDPYVPFTRSAQGFKEALMKDESYRTMLSAGAAFENGYINAYDPTATQRQIKARMKTRGIDASTVLNSPLKLFEAWKAIGSASENANRIAQYHAAIKAGKSKAQAVFESKDLMDFSMGGSWAPIQILIQTVPFMGARLQGLHRLGRGAAENPLAFFIKGSLVGMAGLALWFQYKDDERYKELEEWDKDVYFHFWIGEQHYRLPKPFEVGAIFNTIPERAFERMYNEENDAGKLLLKRFGFMLGETFNFNPIPQAFMPAVESIFNYSFFTGGPITSPWEEKRMGPEQYRYYNSPTMVELARHLPDWMDKFSDPPGKLRSPRHLQHVFSGYFGTLGKYMLMAADVATRSAMSYPAPPERSIADYPVIGSFVRGSQPRRTKYEETFYDLLTRTLQVKNSLSFLNKVEMDERMDLLEQKYEPFVNVAKELEDYRQEISKLNNEVMQIYIDPNLTPKQKREQIDSIQEEKNAVFRDAYGLRPGGAENPLEATASPQDLNFMLERFGMDELPGEMQKRGANATASLIDDVTKLGKKQAETLQ